MNDRYQGPRVERKTNALDNRKLALSAPCPTAEKKWSSLLWRLVNNNPRIIVYTNDPNDTGERNENGRITAALDATTMSGILNNILQACDAEPGWNAPSVQCMNYIFPGGKRSDKPVLVATVMVGKDQEGVVWISVVHYNKDRPKIKFPFGPAMEFGNTFHSLVHRDGTPVSRGELSVFYAKAYVNTIRPLFEQLLVNEWTEPKKKEDGGRSGGGYNRGGGGGGGSSNSGSSSSGSSTDMDDDLPF